MSVTPLEARRAAREVAKQRHPATLSKVPVPEIDRAHAIETLCREWDRTVDRFSTGPDCLERDEAEELLQFLLAAVVHPAAVAGLVFEIPQVRAAVACYDAVRDGDFHPDYFGCDGLSAAITKARGDLDWVLGPLVHGVEAIALCPECVRRRSSVSSWQRRGECPDHGRAL